MKSNVIKYIFFIAVIIIVGVAVYMIYEDNKSNSENTENQTTAQTNQTITDLRMEIVSYDTINPLISNNRNVQEITKLIFEPLLQLDENYKLQPCLATEWAKSGDTSYILKLRSNVKWQDGTSFTAQDVKYTIETLKQINSIYSYNVQHIASVDIIDNYSIRINLDTIIPFFEYNLIFPIVSSTYFAGQDIQNTDKNATPIGTGMYKIESNSTSTVVLKKNPSWWNISEKNAKVDTINVNKYSSMGEAYNAFKLGNIDILTTENINIEDNIGTIGYNKKEFYGREHDFIALNTYDNFLSRWEVRKAISYAIDKSSIVTSVYGGKYYTADNPLDYGNWTFEQGSSSTGYNPDQAKQVLIDGGWSYKYGSWQKVENYKTIRLSINLTVNADNSSQVAVADIIKTSLENIGIKVNVSKLNSASFQTALNNKNYGMIITGTNSSLSPSLVTYFGSGNLANYQNEEANNLLNELLSLTDENKIKEDTNRLIEIYRDDVPYISLYFNKVNVIYSTSLVGEIKPNQYNIFYGIENWYRR